MLRVLLVSSEVTYVPDNYHAAFSKILKACPGRIVAMVSLKVINLALFLTIAKLWAAGCYGVARTLMQNILSAPDKKRKTLFGNHAASFLKADSMNDPQLISWIKQNRIDLIVNMRTRCIFKDDVLRAPRLGCINIHHGMLPKYRGLLCDAYALYEGREAGFSIHQMNTRIDDGAILRRQTIPRVNPLNYTEHVQRSSEVEGDTMAELIQEIEKLDGFPATIPNTTTDVVHTRTPSFETIRSMRKAGLRL